MATIRTIRGVSRKQVRRIIQAAFPDWNGRKITVRVCDTVAFHDLNWCEGTRNEYRAVRNDGATAGMAVRAPWVEQREGAMVAMVPGILVVEHSVFCGNDCGLTIHVDPSDAGACLPDFTPDGMGALSGNSVAGLIGS